MRLLCTSFFYTILLYATCSSFNAVAANLVSVHDHEHQLSFVENKGQWHSNVLYRADLGGLNAVFLEKQIFTFVYYNENDVAQLHDVSQKSEQEKQSFRLHGHRYKVHFLNANAKATCSAQGKRSDYNNYFIGNDPKKWQSHVGIYNAITYEQLYKGIDLIAYSQDKFFKYDFAVAPSADPSPIQMQYAGADKVRIDQSGNLVIQTSVGDIIEQKPYAYQTIDGKKITVPCRFTICSDQTVTFDFPQGYNHRYDLIIDPVLVGATLSGSTGSSNYGHCATYDGEGNIYTGAISFGAGYSTNTGAFDTSFNGGSTDIAISKYSPTATNRIYGTYIGGGGSDYPHSLIVDADNQMHVLGSSASSDFPTTTTAFQDNFGGGVDIVVAILTADGADLVGATYVGGNADDGRNVATSNYGDSYRGEIMTDQWGNTFVACCTRSANFPTTPGVVQGAYNPISSTGTAQDAVVFKLNPDLSEMLFSTYLGGNGTDMAFGVRVAEDNSIYVCGTASGTNFPLGDNPGVQATIAGANDGFILHLNSDASEILNGTFRGTAQADHAFFIDLDDNSEHVLIYGQTDGVMPITPSGTYGQIGGKAFIAAYNYDLDNVEYATVMGGAGSNIVPVAFMIDGCGYIYMSGYSASSTFPTTSNALFSNSAGSFYLGVLEPNAIGLNYGTFYTGGHVDGGTSRFDHNGIVYQGVCSGGGFNTTAGAWASTQSPGWDIAVFKIDFQTPSVNAQASASPQAVGCAPFEVTFTNNGSSAIDYKWFFGDGDSSVVNEPSHMYNDPGVFDVILVASDPASCNIADTAFLQIIVFADTTIRHDITRCASQGPLELGVDLPIVGISHLWHNGSTGNSFTATQSGTYWVESTYNANCMQIDSFVVEMVDPQIQLPPDTTICGNQFTLDATHPDATSYLWQDGSTLPTYTATQGGTYYVSAVVQGCDVFDVINLTLIPTEAVDIADASTCSGVPIVLDATISNPNTTYIWSNGMTTPSVSLDQSGVYSVTITHDNLCTSSDSAEIQFGSITVELGSDKTICSGDNASFDATQAGDVSYAWSNGSNQAILTVSESGVYTVTVSTAEGCVAQDNVTLTVTPPLTPFSLGSDWEVCRGESILLNAPQAVAGITRTWQDGTNSDTYSPTESGIYWLELKSVCDTLRDEVNVVVKELPKVDNPVLMPTAFSPNGDGLNDICKPTVHGISGDYEFVVYNRWGQLVYSTTNPNEGWNGLFNSIESETGVYVWHCRAYVADCEGEHEVLEKGNTTLIR
jgi:gliding motility-associated-like protein